MRLCHAAIALSILSVGTAFGGCTGDPESTVGTSEAANTWKPLQELAPADPVPGSLFGRSLAATPSLVAVGDSNAKAVYVFEPEAHVWRQKAKIIPPADGKQTIEFGANMGAGASSIFVRRRTVEDITSGHAGHVLVFERTTSGWALTQDLSGDPAPEIFGVSFATDGTTLIIGAGSERHSNAAIGSAYVFDRVGGSFVRTQKLQPSPVARTVDSYGTAVAVKGDVLVVSSIHEADRANPMNSEGAIYAYTNSGTAWTFEKRLVTMGGDGASICLAGDVLAVGSNLRREAGIFRRGVSGFVAAPALTSPGIGTNAVVRCDGNRVGVLGQLSDSERAIRLYSRGGPGWSSTDVSLGPSSQAGFAMSNGVLFAEVFANPPRVRVIRFGKLSGEPCTDNASCAGTFCVDGVCCESACGGGDTSDCQACSRAAGSPVDGKCLPTLPSQVCRPARDACDAPDHCDGKSRQCPADLVATNGTPCSGGICTAGVCVASAPGAPPEELGPATHDPKAEAESGCSIGRANRSRGLDVLALETLAIAAALFGRRRPIPRARAS